MKLLALSILVAIISCTALEAKHCAQGYKLKSGRCVRR
jgi:hypothetical protein